MLDLALHIDEPVTLSAISKRQRISQKYLWNIMNTLKAGNLVNAQRGANGGFSLARDAANISLLDIISVMEGYPSIVDCTTDHEVCNRSGTCSVRDVWREVSDRVAAILSDISVAEICKRHLDRQEKEAASYSI